MVTEQSRLSSQDTGMRLPRREEWEGKPVLVKASDLKAGDIYIDRNTGNFAGPETERKLKIVEINTFSKTESGDKNVELTCETEEGTIVHPNILIGQDNFFHVIRREGDDDMLTSETVN